MKLSDIDRDRLDVGFCRDVPDARKDIEVRMIELQDNTDLSHIIKISLGEFGANCEGFAFADSNIDSLYESYAERSDRMYFCAFINDELAGGAGFGPIENFSDPSYCELQKMYLKSSTRGCGIGSRLMETILLYAKEYGYKKIYLETLYTMHGANRLYEKFGFKELQQPLGDTGHFGCDRWMIRDL